MVEAGRESLGEVVGSLEVSESDFLRWHELNECSVRRPSGMSPEANLSTPPLKPSDFVIYYFHNMSSSNMAQFHNMSSSNLASHQIVQPSSKVLACFFV